MINIIINSDPKYQVNKLAVQATVLNVLKHFKVGGNMEIGISIVGDKKMHEINKKYRGIDATTNILSFALEDPTQISQLQLVPKVGFVKDPDRIMKLGDIVISQPELIKDAQDEGVTIEDQLLYLIEHGTRHLIGVHDHD